MKIIKRHWLDLVLIVLWIGCGISVIANDSVSVVAYGCLLLFYCRKDYFYNVQGTCL